MSKIIDHTTHTTTEEEVIVSTTIAGEETGTEKVVTEEPVVEKVVAKESVESRRERRLKAEKRARRWRTFWVIFFLCLIGHIAWCLYKHVYVKPEVPTNSQVEVTTNADEVQKLQEQIATLEGEIANHVCDTTNADEVQKLQKQVAMLEGEISNHVCEITTKPVEGCAQCQLHCECDHGNYMKNVLSERWISMKIKEPDLCKIDNHLIVITCVDCGESMSVLIEQITDSKHFYGEDGICSDCGYKKVVVSTATPKPTATPTLKPTVTPKPTTPVKPTATPCTHVNTREEKNQETVFVGTEGCCTKVVEHTKVYCKNCGLLVGSSDQETATEHKFSGRLCLTCGYKKPLEEAFGKAEGTIEPPKNSWGYDDSGDAAKPVG